MENFLTWHSHHERGKIENPNSQYLNPKQIPNPNGPISKTYFDFFPVLSLVFRPFEFVGCSICLDILMAESLLIVLRSKG